MLKKLRFRCEKNGGFFKYKFDAFHLKYFSFFNYDFYWSMVDLQFGVSYMGTAK